MKTAHWLGIALAVVGSVACGNGPTSPTPQSSRASQVASVVSVTITPDVNSLSVGQTQHFAASVELSTGIPPAGGMVPQWSSTNASVLELDADGNAKAVGVGEATVQAAVGGKTTTRPIRVVP